VRVIASAESLVLVLVFAACRQCRSPHTSSSSKPKRWRHRPLPPVSLCLFRAAPFLRERITCGMDGCFTIVFVLCSSSKAKAAEHAKQLLLQAGACAEEAQRNLDETGTLMEEAMRVLSNAGVSHEHVALEHRAVVLLRTKMANKLSQFRDAKVRRALFAFVFARSPFSISLLCSRLAVPTTRHRLRAHRPAQLPIPRFGFVDLRLFRVSSL
jgi:hypothetical protein